MDEQEWYAEPLGLGQITWLNDNEHDTSRKIPLGFPIPEVEKVTPYRERLHSGKYGEEAATSKNVPETGTASTAKETTKTSSLKQTTKKSFKRSTVKRTK